MKQSSIIIYMVVFFSFMGCYSGITKKLITKIDQVERISLETEVNKEIKSSCSDFMNYAPDENHPEYTPTKFIRVNMHFMQPPVDAPYFIEKEAIKLAYDLMYYINNRLANNNKMNLPIGNDTPVLPVQVQCILTGAEGDTSDKGIYFHRDNELCYFNKKDMAGNSLSFKLYEKYGVGKGKILNLFLQEHHPDSMMSYTYKASLDGVGMPVCTKVAGIYQYLVDSSKYEKGRFGYKEAWTVASIFSHEIGHSLGLSHTWNGNDGCDDTPLNAPCWDYSSGSPCNDVQTISNNVMDYNPLQNAYTPCQIAKIQYGLYRENSPTRKLVIENWCQYNPMGSVVITDSVIWNATKYLSGDIVIEPNGILVVRCTVGLPEKGKIIVKPEGKLIVEDDGRLINICGQKWEGIEIWHDRKEHKKGRVIATTSGNIINNTTIEITQK